MGILASGGSEQGRVFVNATAQPTGQSAVNGVVFPGRFNVAISGTFTGSVQLVRSFDAGTTWLPVTALGVAIVWTAPGTETLEEVEPGVLYSFLASLTAGTYNGRISR
ncbi:MAG TPA: hypothetical protein VF771_11535 [Longimicrobiaceae bacterium]